MKSFRLFLVLLVVVPLAHAHVGLHPSVHDTVASIVERFRETVPPEDLPGMTAEQALALLTEEERDILGSEHITFTVDVPVVVSVYRDVMQGEVPFWLKDRAFETVSGKVTVEDETFEIWSKAFPVGDIGLGVNSISGAGDHYFASIAPASSAETVEVTNIYPGQHTLGVMKVGEMVYSGSSDRIVDLPEHVEGQILLRGDSGRRRDAQLTNIFRLTDYPATSDPDQIVLTWSDDPKTTQAIQWRTNREIESGSLRYIEASQAETGDWQVVEATTEPLENEILVNDPVCNRHTAVLTGLKPGTSYAYAVGDGTEEGWTDPAEFTTAPDGTTPFKFIYMGDAQNGLDTWGKLVQDAYVKQPEAAFYLMAGDLVNRGNERNDWDSFFHNARGIFDRRQLVPCLGNHEYQGDAGPWMYLELFNLPENGPETIPAECGYSFTYSNALFVVLDSNLPAADQAEWLEEQLANSDATWKIAVYHHPAYSSGPRRDNTEVRTLWGALFDKYRVDLALQGHDHAYLRTYPMFDGKRVDSPSDGTIYIVSVSGTKFYDQGDFDYTEFGMTNVATYQVLDIEIGEDTLKYKAYDIDGAVRDEFVIEK
ncbi:MAG: metallophosphoesterase [Candidatus Hydrogenedentes bacterium]|nr:metallophosphoesterase [Candidatus Hydrogenedentota bacterium]